MSKINEAALSFPHWNTGMPSDRMLTEECGAPGLKVIQARFLIDDGEVISIRTCSRRCEHHGVTYKPRWSVSIDDGLLSDNPFEPVRWMQLPESVGDDKAKVTT